MRPQEGRGGFYDVLPRIFRTILRLCNLGNVAGIVINTIRKGAFHVVL